MNQEHFDQLAQGLATGLLTRRQVLKGFATGIALGFIGILSPRCTSDAAAATTYSSSAYKDCINTVDKETLAKLEECLE